MGKLKSIFKKFKYALLQSVLFVFCSSSVIATDLNSFVKDNVESVPFKGSVWGGIATYTEEPEKEIFSYNADTRLTPASTLKLLTTAAALEILGADYRFETSLYANGIIDENGVLEGDLYIKAGGDPTLGSKRVVGSTDWQAVIKEWVQAIKEANLTRIQGNIYVDESLFEGPSIAPKVNWENMGNYYAAPVSPLCFNDNLFEIHFKPESKVGVLTAIDHTEPDVVDVSFKNNVITAKKNSRDNAFVYAAPNQYELTIEGTIPANANGFSIKAALPNSALFTANTLRNALKENKVTVDGSSVVIDIAPDYTKMMHLAEHKSPALKDIVVIVNKRSFNLYAEMLLRQLAVHEGQKGSLQNGLSVLVAFLKKNKVADGSDMVLYDGSGLSRDNLLTPRTLLNLLVYMSKSENFDYFYNSLATPNDRGDLLVLRKFLAPQNKVDTVRVKGGTIDSVKTLAGYVSDANDKPIAFVLMANNLASKNEAILRIHENIIKELLK